MHLWFSFFLSYIFFFLLKVVSVNDPGSLLYCIFFGGGERGRPFIILFMPVHNVFVLQATYIADGIKKKSLLLASGWWGISRHFHYIPEIAASVLWTVPTACEGHLIPFFYAVYLTILLTDRAFRDDVR